MGVDVEAIEADNRVLLQSKVDKIKAEREKPSPRPATAWSARTAMLPAPSDLAAA